MLGRFFESLYNKVFVNIVVDRSKSTVYIELCSKEKVVSSYEEVFQTTSLDNDMLDFISTYTVESPYHYISILDKSTIQGAIPTCAKNKIGFYEDVSSVEHKCFDKKWMYYTSQEELYALERSYDKLGIDFIFSPFVLLADFFADKINDYTAMYILVEDNYISLSVFEDGKLLFSEHLDLEHTESDELLIYEDEDDEDISIDLDDDEGIDLEDIDAIDDLDSLDDFGDIEDLDSIEDIDEFAESKDIEEEFHESVTEEEMPTNEADGFNEDYQRFSLIQSSVNRFYQSEKYDSLFIENVYIADGVGVSHDLKRYLEEEMFLSVYIRHVDLATRVCELAKSEFSL